MESQPQTQVPKDKPQDKKTRRDFLRKAGLLGAGFFLGGPFPDLSAQSQSPKALATGPSKQKREKLRIGVIGVGGRGWGNLHAVKSEIIAGICDVDHQRLAKASKAFPKAVPFADYREMIDKGGLDAVVVSTPDHSHAPAAAQAIRAGLDVYCEKPLTHSVQEARTLTQLAKKHKTITQMGIQIHAGANYRRCVEIIRSGALGSVKEVHVFCEKSWSGMGRKLQPAPKPPNLDWELWLGPTPSRPFVTGLHPATWRGFWEYGSGTLGDMACHYLDLAHWALGLGVPHRIRARGPEPDDIATPPWMIVDWEHAANKSRGKVKAHWYDGGKRPALLEEIGMGLWRNGVLFVGDKGWMLADYGRHVLGPKKQFRSFKAPPQTIPNSIGHHREWIEACKTRGKTSCSFEYSGPLTEAVLLGAVAYRLGREIVFDVNTGRCPGDKEANLLIAPKHRKGFEV